MWAVIRTPADGVRVVQSLDAVCAALAEPLGECWVDLEPPCEPELRELAARLSLADSAVEDCLSGEQLPRVDEFDNNLFLVLYGAFGVLQDQEFEPRKLAVFCGARYLITVHGEPLRSVTTLRERAMRHPEQILKNGVDSLLCTIVDLMADNYIHTAAKYQDEIEVLEEDALVPPFENDVLAEVPRLRRELLEIRQVAGALRDLMIPLAAGEYDYIAEQLGTKFSQVRDHMTTAMNELDAMRDRLRSVVESYHISVATQTNEIMRTLTIFATILLPMSLVAGIFGMNVPLGAAGDHLGSIWIILGGMAAFAGALLWMFKRRGWL